MDAVTIEHQRCLQHAEQAVYRQQGQLLRGQARQDKPAFIVADKHSTVLRPQTRLYTLPQARLHFLRITG